MNYRITIQYDGSRYNGWQKQGNTSNTIQGRLEEVLERMAGQAVEVHGAGRTDAGVHALGQTANFHLQGEWDPGEIRRYLNRYLPDDIEVTAIDRVPPRFHSRLSAREKVYAYRIGTGGRKAVFERKYRYLYPGKLDVEAMKQGAAFCIGTHDFKSFCANRHMKKSTVRTITEIAFGQKEGDLVITFTGDGFLYHMIRILTGTLLEIGSGQRRPEEMKEILEGKNRALAGRTAPAQGLMLVAVRYGDEYEV